MNTTTNLTLEEQLTSQGLERRPQPVLLGAALRYCAQVADYLYYEDIGHQFTTLDGSGFPTTFRFEELANGTPLVQVIKTREGFVIWERIKGFEFDRLAIE
jgi:hypothetical protein